MTPYHCCERAARLIHHWTTTVDQIAVASGVPTSVVIAVAAGDAHALTADVLHRLADYFRVSPTWLAAPAQASDRPPRFEIVETITVVERTWVDAAAVRSDELSRRTRTLGDATPAAPPATIRPPHAPEARVYADAGPPPLGGGPLVVIRLTWCPSGFESIVYHRRFDADVVLRADAEARIRESFRATMQKGEGAAVLPGLDLTDWPDILTRAREALRTALLPESPDAQ